jgi:hypothetical protein|tara:strand:+ start:214 stop:396 length:183 start_codon:yes stop_codon:yes gene_type:complete
MLDSLGKVTVISNMDKEQKDKFNIEFPESMTKDKIEWIKQYIFKFLERNACEVIKTNDSK